MDPGQPSELFGRQFRSLSRSHMILPLFHWSRSCGFSFSLVPSLGFVASPFDCALVSCSVFLSLSFPRAFILSLCRALVLSFSGVLVLSFSRLRTLRACRQHVRLFSGLWLFCCCVVWSSCSRMFSFSRLTPPSDLAPPSDVPRSHNMYIAHTLSRCKCIPRHVLPMS